MVEEWNQYVIMSINVFEYLKHILILWIHIMYLPDVLTFTRESLHSLRPSEANMSGKCPSLVQIMACRMVGTKPLSEVMMECC